MKTKYILDGDDFEVKPENRVWTIVKTAIEVVLISIAATLVGYLLLCLVFSTRTERALKKETRQYRSEYKSMMEKEKLLIDEINGLEIINDDLYNTIFNSPAPQASRMQTIRYSVQDTTGDSNIIRNSAVRLEKLCGSASVTEENFRYILKKVTGKDFAMPPMTLPVKNFSYARIGASVGEKQNPFFRVTSNHTGLDIFTETGEPVFASADGIVAEINRSFSGLGNTVTINHAGGYSTRYCHLAGISVGKGAYVRRGQHIGTTGISGQSIAPQLHYEVRCDGEVCDPVHYFYYNLNPEEYANCVLVSSSTGQSLD